MSYLNREIERVRAALRRHELRLYTDFITSPGDCCPGCKYGSEYNEAARKAERTRAWLIILLTKRNHVADQAEARMLKCL